MKKKLSTQLLSLSLKAFQNGSIETLMERHDLTLVSSPGKELQEFQSFMKKDTY